MGDTVPHRTLQYRLRYLAEQGRAVTEGQRRGMKYFPASATVGTATEAEVLSLSRAAQEIQNNVSRPLLSRKIVGYNRNFLDSYRPNVSAYLSESERIRLRETGAVQIGFQPAGTYARNILDRLLIDINSVAIQRHVKVRGTASPDDPLLLEYWRERISKRPALQKCGYN